MIHSLDYYRRLFLLVVFFGLISTSLLSALASNIDLPFWSDYGNHVAAIVQAKQALDEGQFPLRVAPSQHDGWRYPVYQFYSPSSYYFSALINRWITDNPWIAFKLTLIFALTVGAIYVYRLGTWLTASRPAGLLAGCSFLISPYLLTIIDRWGGFNETLAICLIPVVFYSTLQCYFHPENIHKLLIAAVTWYLLITTHTITFVYTSVFIGIVFVSAAFLSREYPLKNLLFAGTAYGLGYLLALWFLAPIAYMAPYLIVGRVLQYSPARFNFMAPLPDLIAVTAGYATPLVGTYQPMNSPVHPALGWPFLLATITTLYSFFYFKKKHSYWAGSLCCAFFIAFILVWSPFDIWSSFPKILTIGQYCWRLLSQINWLGALLVSWAVSFLFKNRLGAAHVAIGLLLISVVNSHWLPILGRSPVNVSEIISKPFISDAQYDYLINLKRFPSFIDYLGTIALEEFTSPEKKLLLNKAIPVSKDLLIGSPDIKLKITGTVAQLNKQNHTQLFAQINNKTIAHLQLKEGSFHWEIPLANSVPSVKNGFFNLRFTLEPQSKISPGIQLPVIQQPLVTLQGFSKQPRMLSVSTVQSHCRMQLDTLICKLSSLDSYDLVQLPVFYYPKMLDIRINGVEVPYYSVLAVGTSTNKLMAAVKPALTPNNVISIRFRGLPWANWGSKMAWSGLFLILLITLYKRVKLQK